MLSFLSSLPHPGQAYIFKPRLPQVSQSQTTMKADACMHTCLSCFQPLTGSEGHFCPEPLVFLTHSILLPAACLWDWNPGL